MSTKARVTAGVVIAVAIVVVVCGWWFFSALPHGTYYTQVDNTRTEELEPTGGVIDPTGGMTLSYTLPAYDEKGGEAEITFGTDRELREDAYLKVVAVPIRGVVEWGEVQFDEIPAQAQEKLPAPQAAN